MTWTNPRLKRTRNKHRRATEEGSNERGSNDEEKEKADAAKKGG